MTREMHGKAIKRVWWNGANGDQSMTSSESITLEMSATYNGDRDEFWVVQKQDGKEISRHNCKYIATIDWA